MFDKFISYTFLFFIYSIIGWIIESIYVGILDKKLVNRGFLIGPYLPIYGYSSIIMILYLNQYKDNIITVFILAIVVCTILEYITSYIMEKLFKARWWDYSNKKFNVNGRVCLKNSLLFGLLSILLIYFMNPLLIKLIHKMNNTWLIVITIILLIIYIIDNIISFNVIFKLKKSFNEFKCDATNEIKNIINSKLKQRYLQKRLFKAFPRIKLIRKDLTSNNNLHK